MKGKFSNPKQRGNNISKAKFAKGKERITQAITDRFGKYIILVGKYKGSGTTTKFKCTLHGVFSINPSYLMNNKYGCPQCANSNRRPTDTITTFRSKFNTNKKCKDLTFTLASDAAYIDSYTPIKLWCKTHRLHFKDIPNNVLQGCNDCPQCKVERNTTEARQQRTGTFKTTIRYKREVKVIHGSNIKVIGEYVGARKHSLHKCNTCKHEWNVVPTSILKGVGCPICNMMGTAPASLKDVKLGNRIVQVQGHEDIALVHLTKHLKILPNKIVVSKDGKVPTIEYIFGSVKRRYYPDMYIPSNNEVIEVKGFWSFGLDLGRDKATKAYRTFRKNCAKAKAVIDKGYKFNLMLFDNDKELVRLPKKWYEMKLTELRSKLC